MRKLNEAISQLAISAQPFTVLDKQAFDRECNLLSKNVGCFTNLLGSLICEIIASSLMLLLVPALDTANPSAGTCRLQRPVGTWKGTFVSCEAAAKPCYAGRTNPLTLTVSAAGFS